MPRPIPSLQRSIACQSPPTPPSPAAYHLESGSGGLVVAATLAIVFSLVCYQLPAPWSPCADPHATPDTSSDPAAMTTADLPAGRPGNLTPEEEEKLRQLWALVLRVFGSDDTNPAAPPSGVSNAPSEQTTASQPKKKRALFSRRGTNASSTDTPSPGVSSVVDPSSLVSGDADDKHGQHKQFQDAMANLSPDAIRETMWTMVKHDNPDALLLRFLRARKWDVEKALVMMVSTLNWRATEMHVDDDIMKNGEGAAAVAEK
ncbi:hypothetical protein IMZ48_22375, partial [Candidatus Bathyarchaeota archaeon]|nr:hypothetical protein [Candidatus Bathyarchaeota archaeon]